MYPALMRNLKHKQKLAQVRGEGNDQEEPPSGGAPPLTSMLLLGAFGHPDQPHPLNSAMDLKTDWKQVTQPPKTAAETYADSISPASSQAAPGLQTQSQRPSDATKEVDLDHVVVNLREAIGILEPTRSSTSQLFIEPKKICKSDCSCEADRACAAWCLRKCVKKAKGTLNGSSKSVPKKLHIIQYWRKQLNNHVAKKKSAVIVDGNSDLKVSYQELDEFSNSIAYNLKQLKFSHEFKNHNPKNELVIAVSLPACYEYIVILLAILKLGAAFLPLSYDLPAERIAEIIKLTRPILTVITSQEDNLYMQAHKLIEFDIIHLDDIWQMLSSGGSLSKSILPFKDPIQGPDKNNPYPPMWKRNVAVSVIPSDAQELQAIYYPSLAFINRANWENSLFPFLSTEHCIIQPNCDTVDFIADILTQLCGGCTLVALQSPIDYYIPESLFNYCQTYKIRRLNLFPSLLKACAVAMQLFDHLAQTVNTVRYWFCVGGFLSCEVAEMFFELAPVVAQLIHMYQTEDGLGALSYEIYETAASMIHQNFRSRLPVGTPVPNTTIYVLDENLKRVPDGDIGEIYVAGHQLPNVELMDAGQNQYYVKNPFSKKKSIQTLLRTLDYGRIVSKTTGGRVLIHDLTRARHYYVENQIVWLLHIDMYLKRLTNLVSKSHTLCYRPNEDDQIILAFCVMQSKNVTWKEVEDELCNCLPLSMIPEVVAIDTIPMHPTKPDLPDENVLLRIYRERRLTRTLYTGWATCGITDPAQLHAAKILAYVIFTFLGIPIKELMENCLEIPYLSIKRATVTKGAFIIKELHNNRYPIYMDDFMYAPNLQSIIDEMVKARRERGFISNAGPADEIMFIKNRYKLEIMVNANRSGACSLLAKYFTQRGQLDYYAQVGNLALRKFLDASWPIFAKKKISVVIRRKREQNKIVGACFNMDWHDEMELTKTIISPNIGYKLELIEFLEAGLTDEHFHQENANVLQICYIGFDFNVLTTYEIHGLTDKLIRSILILGKVKGFEAVVIVTYDYFTWDICVNNYAFHCVRECQVNQFVAADGTRPYALCPDSTVSTMLYKNLSKVDDIPRGKRETMPKLIGLIQQKQAQINQQKPWNQT